MTKTLWTIIVILIIVVGGWFYFSQSEPKVDSLQIGVIQSLTGNAAYYGELNRRGVEIARKVIAERYPDLNIEVFHADSFYTPKGGVDAYTNLQAIRNLDAIITHGSPVSVAVQPLAEQDGILQMGVSSSASAYRSPDDLSFRVSPSSAIETELTINFIKEQNYERVAVLYFQNDFGVSVLEAFKEGMNAQAAETAIVLEEGFPQDQTDFRTLLSKLRDSDAEAVFFIGLAANIANAMNQAQDLGLDVQFLGTRSSEDPTLLTNAPENSDGLIYTYAFDPQNESPMVQKFAQAFNAEYGELPDGYAAEGYAGFILTVEAFVGCGKDTTCIKEYLSNLKDYETVFGPLSFDEYGDVTYGFFLKTVRNGEFVKFEN